MLGDMDIIYMNGRIYDARLGRFLQADPFIQSAANTQSYNRYSYLLNNPLNATDPSGFFLKKWWNEIRPFVAVIVAVVATVVCENTACGSAAWAWIGAGSGAAGAAANGGNILQGAVTGLVSAAAFYAVGSAFQGVNSGSTLGTSLSAGDYAAKVLAHSMVSGVMSVLQGGKFGHGFAAAGVTQAFSGGIDSIGSDSAAAWAQTGNRIARIVAAAVVGGTASTITGGKFANGAITGAFSRAFNDDMHGQKELSKKGEGLLKSIEELRLQPYDDQTGLTITSWVKGATIGYGHLISKSEWSLYKNGITTAQADALFAADIAPFISTVNNVLSVDATQQQFDAMVMLAYNIGISSFTTSSVVSLINNPSTLSSYTGIESAWKAWNRSQGSVSQGLINRRNSEWDIYSNGVYKKW